MVRGEKETFGFFNGFSCLATNTDWPVNVEGREGFAIGGDLFQGKRAKEKGVNGYLAGNSQSFPSGR